jgi:hypothetical protein
MWEWNGVTWTQLPTVAPAAGIGKGAFDPFRQCFVLVVTPGGFSLPQTWEWKGATWSPGNSTIPTHGHSPIDLAFDVARNVTLAFGNNVTAVWNGTTWFAADQSPVGGQEQWMVADTVRQRLVLLRGGQTWEWDGRWRVAAVGAPANKTGLALAFDRGRARTVSFGGTSTPTTTAIRNETWEWDGLTWTRATPPVSPPGRDGAGLVADEARHQVLLFGGTGSGPLADTWTWDGVTWTQRIGAVNPSARLNPGMAYDEHRQRVVMFGGRGPAILPDTWEWDGTTWALAASTGPSLRELPGMAYDPRRSRVVLYGGLSSHLLDTWEWDGSAWLPTPVAPGLVIFPVIDFDPRRGRMLAFGELVDVTTFQSVGTAVFELADDAVGVPCHPLAAGGAGLAIDDRAPRLGSTVHATVTTPLASSAAIVLLGTEVLAPALDLSPIGLAAGCRSNPTSSSSSRLPAARRAGPPRCRTGRHCSASASRCRRWSTHRGSPSARRRPTHRYWSSRRDRSAASVGSSATGDDPRGPFGEVGAARAGLHLGAPQRGRRIRGGGPQLIVEVGHERARRAVADLPQRRHDEARACPVQRRVQ